MQITVRYFYVTYDKAVKFIMIRGKNLFCQIIIMTFLYLRLTNKETLLTLTWMFTLTRFNKKFKYLVNITLYKYHVIVII